MRLQQRLDKIRESFEKQVPPETLAVMHRAAEELRNSGIADRALKEGQIAPAFELENSSARRVSLTGLLARGPAVLTFFRGHW